VEPAFDRDDGLRWHVVADTLSTTYGDASRAAD
jgi:hypothetical protein